jgi:hypothetical protein
MPAAAPITAEARGAPNGCRRLPAFAGDYAPHTAEAVG